MRHLIKLLLLLMLCITCNAYAGKDNSNLSDLNGMNNIERLMPFDQKEKPGPEQLYLRSLSLKLASTPISKRAEVLKRLSEKTKWGSYQRFIAYYVCAWYGVNYNNTLDYLLHSAFWWDWKIGSEKNHPFSFDDVSVDLLYALYEHNHDFKILHDILTTQSDAGTAELIEGLTEDAVQKHPRGLLHIADISKKGFNLLWKLLHLSPRDENHPFYISGGTEGSLKTLRIYVSRVAADPKDPLNKTARNLLNKKQR